MSNPFIKTPENAISCVGTDDKGFFLILGKEIKKMKVKQKIDFDFGAKKRFKITRII